MKKLSAFIFLFSAAALSVSAQKKLSYKPIQEEWAENPKIHAIPPEYANEHALLLLVDEKLDFRREVNNMNVYRTYHKIVKVLDHEGIEEFNTISIPHWYAKRIPLIKARTILPNGKVKDISKDMILTSQDGSGNYKVIIAMEGVEKNAEIELLVKEATPASYFGNVHFQYDIPVLQSNFEMSYPKDITFELKSYSGYPALHEYLSGNRKHVKIGVSDIAPLRNEPYSNYDQHRMRLEYRVADFGSDLDKTQELTWDSLTRVLHRYNYGITEKERKAVNSFLTELGVTSYDDEFEKIKKIEDGIKRKVTLYAVVDYDERKEIYATNNFRSMSLYDAGYYEPRDILDTIISKKAATRSGYIKLFAACFTQAGVKHELGMAPDHDDYVLDPNFPNFNQLDYTLFYLPNQKKYLSPLDIYLRTPFVPAGAAGSKGVFSTIPPYKRKGDITAGLYEIRTIKPLTAADTRSDVTANVTFTKDMDAQMDIAYAYSGYEATNIRTNLAILKDKRLQEYMESLIKVADKKEDVVKYTLSNQGFGDYNSNKPLEVYASVTTARLTEKAGPKYLFRAGAIIGQQMELYSEDKRKMPVDLDYPHSATHKITINIPKGYKVTNPQVLRMNEEFVNGNLDPVMSFTSDYKLDGDKLIVTVSENYSQVHFPVADYERFRKVINRAADFSKVMIVLEKGHTATKPKAKKKVAA